jgi:hypothetical protein
LSACSFSGLLRGRPLPRRLIGSIPSRVCSSTFESWTLAAVRTTASGTPPRSETTWRFEPGLPRSVGFGPVFSRPPFGRHGRRVEARASPVDLARLPEAIEEHAVQPPPHPGLLPVAQPPPAGGARPAAHLLGEHLPGDARLEHEDDAGQGGPVGPPRPAALGPERLLGKQRLDGLPQLFAHQFLRHAGERSMGPLRFCKAL